ncbi:MAG TPA: hypothetical protein VMQ50_15535 [Casimicrobiaceae bacterium]|nr:hypothetical protein [Casimicrobiaceae bacterium]
MRSVVDLPDPRTYPERIDPVFAQQLDCAAASLASASMNGADRNDAALREDMLRALRRGDADWLCGLLAAAPSASMVRHLRRRLLEAWAGASADDAAGLAATLFALPIIVVTGRDSGGEPATLGDAFPDVARLRAILIEHGALGGNASFAISAALVGPDAIDVQKLPELLTWTRLNVEDDTPLRTLEGSAITITGGDPAVHLRFLMGSALAAPGTVLAVESRIGAWGLPLAHELARQLASPGISVLALPRAPQEPLLALQEGRAAQREVGAQLFASNAIRHLRGSVGEPAAVISAHRCADAPGGGELRLSLSSAFDPRQAQGFRCPLFPGEHVGDVADMLVALLRDCRVSEVHVLPALHSDRDVNTGLTLLFRADSLAAAPEGIQ